MSAPRPRPRAQLEPGDHVRYLVRPWVVGHGDVVRLSERSVWLEPLDFPGPVVVRRLGSVQHVPWCRRHGVGCRA